jgi:hypothetical protein
VIGSHIDTRKWSRAEVKAALAPLQAATGAALERFADDFAAALRRARDLSSLALARCIQRLDANDLAFKTVAARYCEALVELGQAHILPALIANFLERDIDPRPLLGRAPAANTATWGTLPPAERLRRVMGAGRGSLPGWTAPFGGGCLGCRDPRAIAAVSRLIRHPYRGATALSGE